MWIKQHRSLFNVGRVVVLSLFASVEMVAAQDQATNEIAAPELVKAAKPSRDELKDKQLDVSLETRDIERVLGKLKKASDLAKQRITEAAVTTESVTTSLNKGDAKAARADAKQASEKFKEIVKQLEALLKEETPQQIAEAKQLATELAKLEREFAEKFEGVLNPLQVTSSGKTKVDPKSQVSPMMDKDMKVQGEGGESKETSNGQAKSDDTPKSPERQGKGQKTDSKPNDQSKSEADSGEKPDGQKKPADVGTSDEAKDPGKTNPDGGTGQERDKGKQETGDGQQPDEAKSDDVTSTNGGDASSKRPDGTKGEKDPDESGNDKSKDAQPPNGSGTDKERRTDGNTKPGAGLSAEQLREAVARRAEKLAETGKTLQDVLNTIARSDNPADKDAAARIQAVLNEFDMKKLVEQMDGVGGMVRSRKDADAKLSSFDLAERLEIIAQRLDAAYRGIVAPQAEELRKLEALLIEMREKLDELETPSQVAAWHREVRELLDRLDQLGVSLEARNQLEKEMQKGGFGLDRDPTRRTLDWGLINDLYVAPHGYQASLALIQEEVQNRIQSLVLGDFGRLSDDSTPPMYQEMVDRYYEVLSGETGRSPESRETGSNRRTKSK